MTGRATGDVHRAVAEVLARERLRIVATLIRTTGDWELAEDAVADAAERALVRWADDGVPDNPAAWLTTTARRRAIDVLRRRDTERTKLAQIAMQDTPGDEPSTDPIDDDRLRLVFTCCHPALSMEARVALTLKVVSNLSTAAIGRVFLVSENTMGQRLLRAKQKIANAAIPYRVPTAEALPERLDGVLAVIYLVFTAGYTAATDDEDNTAGEAIRLGRLVVELMPESGEARGLLALMLLQHARRAARVVDGELVLLEDQDRSLWDTDAISEALCLVDVSESTRGQYRIQAELAAVHATALDAASTDWLRIVALYDELLAVHPSPVVALNRAVAVGMSDGPLAGLHALDAVAADMPDFHLVPAARGELLARAGRADEARAELDRAIALAPTDVERRQLAHRRNDLGG